MLSERWRGWMRGVVVAIAALVVALPARAQTELIDPEFESYKPVEGISGSLKSIGSDTMNNVVSHWAEEFRRHHPSVKVEIEGKGSKTAPPALIEGLAQFGAMSREMKPSEIDAFEKKFGYKPTALHVAVDCIAIFVHKDNPIGEITSEQLRRVYSVEGPQLTWGDLGVEDPEFKSKPVSLYGRLSNSGTYDFFKEHALGNADFKSTVKEQPGSSAVVQAVGTDRYAIGYSAAGYQTAAVKVIPLRTGEGTVVPPTYANALSGEYPLARFLLLYVNHDPRTALDPLRAQFIRLVFSREGQQSVLKDGYYPVPIETAREDLTRVGLTSGT